MYNADLTIASLFVVSFMLVHYVRSRVHTTHGSTSRLFPVIMVSVLALGTLDLLAVGAMGDPQSSISLCLHLCTAYTLLELLVAALMVFYLPLIMSNATSREKRRLHYALAPVFLVMLAVAFVNEPTGVLFTITSDRRYAFGGAGYLLSVCYLFYISLSLTIAIKERARMEPYKRACVYVMVAIAIAGIIVQAVWYEYRCIVFTYTLIAMEMYMSFQIPEKRTDTLTELYQRSAFFEIAQRMLQHGYGTRYAMLYTNIYEFKAINELFGQETGDRVLSGVAQELHSYVGARGVVGRLKDDRFAMLLPADQLDIEQLLEQTDESALRAQFGCSVHLVFGIYHIEDAKMDVEIASDRARLALDSLHGSRMKRYALYDIEQERQFLDAHEFASDLERSLARDDFEVYVQPMHDLATQRIVAAEALVRWHHPERGMVMPGAFIPLFESNGQIAQLDSYVRDRVCAFQKSRIDAGKPTVPISTNISRAELSPDLGEAITQAVKAHGIPAACMAFEITESTYATCPNDLEILLQTLHGLGFELLLDDFGSGYSSLSMLENADFDYLKIDRDFLVNIMGDTSAGTVAQAVIVLSHELGISVIVEGIETRDQALLMYDMGAEIAQGFYFNRPMPLSDFAALLDADTPPQDASDGEA